MQPVEFTQFMRPNGRPVPVTIDVADDLKPLADELVTAGYRFECEELTTGEAHLDCSNDDGVLAMKLVPNGPAVPGAVNELIREAHVAYKTSEDVHGRDC
jgi:hypothetical protein